MSLADITLAARRAPPWTITVAVGAGSVFLLLAALVALRVTVPVDLALMIGVQSVASYPLDLVANAHTVIGQLVVTLAAAAVLAIALHRRFRRWAWLAPMLILATGAIEVAFKLTIAQPSPPEEFGRSFVDVLGVKGLPYAFPSGHVARLTFLSVLVAGVMPARWLGRAALAFVAATVFLRVYIGDHWPSDALGGAALGLSVGALAVAWVRVTARR